MKRCTRSSWGWAFTLLGLLLSIATAHAIEGLKLAVVQTNAVLSWPSAAGETYIVQWRGAFDTNQPWTSLSTNLPAAPGTNWTSFTHTNGVAYPPPPAGGGGGSPIPPPLLAATPAGTTASGAPAATAAKPAKRKPAPSKLPPVPWDPAFLSVASGGLAPLLAGNPQPTSGPSATTNATGGFYRVVREGISLFGYTNGATLTGSIELPVEFGINEFYGTPTAVTLLVDGSAVRGTDEWELDGSTIRLQLETDRLSNDPHYLTPQVHFENLVLDPTEAGNQTSLAGTGIEITTTNQLLFPQWANLTGVNKALFEMTSVRPNVNWTITIKDSSNTVVRTLTGYSADGQISASWNLKNTGGVSLTNVNTDPVFYSQTTITPAGGGQSSFFDNPPLIQPLDAFPQVGGWAVAYEQYYEYFYTPQNFGGFLNYSHNIYNVLLTALQSGGDLYYQFSDANNPYPHQEQTFPLRTKHWFQNPTGVETNQFWDRALLVNFLASPNVRNAYLDGHGSPGLMLSYIRARNLYPAVRHRYRFAFVDGCESAASSTLATAFNIYETKPELLSYYENSGIRPGAFVGNSYKPTYSYTLKNQDGTPRKTNVGGTDYAGTMPWQTANFGSQVFFHWHLLQRPLYRAIDDAKGVCSPTPIGLTPIGGFIRIFGYDNMLFNEFNHAADWPPQP